MLRMKDKTVMHGFSTVILYPCEASQKSKIPENIMKLFFEYF